MLEQTLAKNLAILISRFGDLGVFLAMFAESSIIPIPSEVVIATAAALGMPLVSIVIFGSIGSTLGAMVGYCIGRSAAMPVILRFGKYVFIKPHHIKKAEDFARKYGTASVLIGRVVPIIPFKVFSIAAGIVEVPFFGFVACTLLGVLPRIIILALIGSTIVKYKIPAVCLACFIILALIIFKLIKFKKASAAQNGDS